MTDDRSKTPRTLLVADHLWEAFSTMAVEMGGDRDSLINQALYTFARLNGFLVPADLKRLAGLAPAPLTTPARPFQTNGNAAPESSRPRAAPPPPPELSNPRAAPPVLEGPSRPRPPPPAPPMPQAGDDQKSARPQANPDRMAEIAQQLAGSGMLARSSSNPPPVASPRDAPLVEVDDSLLGEEHQSTSLELPNLADLGVARNGAPAAPQSKTLSESLHDNSGETPAPGVPRSLVLLSDGRELDRVVKERFLIGRGKHCDLIINSGKVSREHAAITREGAVWFIEDLGSSNGTWFDKRRISRRQIQDGDEYFICSEKIGCTFR